MNGIARFDRVRPAPDFRGRLEHPHLLKAMNGMREDEGKAKSRAETNSEAPGNDVDASNVPTRR
jgi:hypothetical protein